MTRLPHPMETITVETFQFEPKWAEKQVIITNGSSPAAGILATTDGRKMSSSSLYLFKCGDK